MDFWKSAMNPLSVFSLVIFHMSEPMEHQLFKKKKNLSTSTVTFNEEVGQPSRIRVPYSPYTKDIPMD